MRGWLIVIMSLLMATVVLAQNATAPKLCTDSDNGGAKSNDAALTVLGEVKYGIQKEKDVCLTGENGVSINKSKYLKEYFCSPEDKREFKVYDCVKLGFEGCENGLCKGKTGTSQTQQQQQQQVSACGNKILEKNKGEECDPPQRVCFGRTSAEYGICDSNCKCRIAQAAKEAAENAPAVCGDKFKQKDEECEEDTDCPSNYVCSSCKCVKILTPEEIEAMKQAAQQGKAPKTEEHKTSELPEVNLTGENFNETAGLKATSGIAGFFMHIFSWIASLFS